MNKTIEMPPEVTEEVTLQDQVNLLQGLYSVQDLQGLKFAVIVTENIETISEVTRPLDKIIKPTPELEEFVMRMHEFAQNDPIKQKEFEEMHPEIVAERNKALAVVDMMLKERCELKLRKIPKAILPHTMTARQYMSIKSIIH